MKKYELLKQLQEEQLIDKATVEQICAEWNWTVNYDETSYIAPVTNITINKGKIVKVEVTNDTEINRLKERIEDLEIELEAKDDFMQGMKFSYENRIAELERQIAELNKPQVTIELVDDPLYNEEESDAMPQFNIPEEYKDNDEIKSAVERFTEEYINAKEIKLGGEIIYTVEQHKEQILVKANKEIQVIATEIQKADQYKISYTKLYNEKNQTVSAVKGNITLAGKEYVFKYGATHEYPCVYGCMDMELIKEAKDAIDKTVHMIKDETEKKHAYDVVYAFDKGIVAWQTDDGAFKGYTKEYAFVWDGTSAVPCGATIKNALDEMKPYRKMNASWGNGFVQRANDIMAFCKTIDKHTKTTKEVVVETKEELHVAQEIEDLDI